MVVLIPAAPQPGHPDHAVAFYGSDEEFLRAFLPACESGLERGEPTVVMLERRKNDLVRSALGDPEGITFLPHDEHCMHPPGALTAVLDRFEQQTDGGAQPLHLLGELPVPVGLAHDMWVRYEAAVNHVLDGLPVQALCAWDETVVPAAVQMELLRTHPAVVTGDGKRRANTAYLPPDRFLSNRTQVTRDPLEDLPPAFELVDPTPSAARRACATLAAAMQVRNDTADDLVVGVGEVLTNALLHGEPPVVVQGWGTTGRVVVAVHDGGPGPDDPLVGLRPRARGTGEGGRGLWITHQLCHETALARTADGFTVRLAAGRAGAATAGER